MNYFMKDPNKMMFIIYHSPLNNQPMYFFSLMTSINNMVLFFFKNKYSFYGCWT